MTRAQRWGFAASFVVFLPAAFVLQRGLDGNWSYLAYPIGAVAGALVGSCVRYLVGRRDPSGEPPTGNDR